MSASESLPVDRIRSVEGSHNVRDLGGLVAADGRKVRRGRIFRSDYPGFADVAGGEGVRALGLRSVVDLRRRAEADLELVSWADHGVEHHRIPLSAGGASSWHAKYHAYLTHRPETVVLAVRRVMDVGAHPVLFHCAAGKDRTGAVAALVLSVLGVDAEQVVADYVLTEAGLEPVMQRLGGIDFYAEMLGQDGLEGQRPRAENMRGFLAWLDAEGGAVAWLLAHGINAEEIEEFRTAMLETDESLA
ncbi:MULTISPECIES: tyrosine-protein phosphatase [unclassified Nocardioides]|uniref:tyrosine-protein phosphatase n=1 Tax=unclassified Nocardioides TaxID=2615069 RepID=UPI00070FBD90|nr:MULTISPECIES: tyrosine-protein phosphatase [unclassified Nocardioides]